MNLPDKNKLRAFAQDLWRRIFRPEPRYRRFRFMLYGAFALAVLLPAAFVIYVLTEMPSLESLENPSTSLSTIVYSADKKILGTYYNDQDRVNVKRTEIPRNLHDALIATEDIRFYEHSGVDPNFVLTAPLLILKGDLRGGSTITQQLARNLYDAVGRERSVLRKIKEAVVAVYLERRYTKTEILTSYLNTVPFGGTTYGIQSAAKSYFGKSSSELKPQESALLVGLLKGPSVYSPYRHPKRALDRRNTVLDQMNKYGFITDRELAELKRTELGVKEFRADAHNEGLAPYFREQLRPWIKEWCQKRGLDMYTSGIRVYTTIHSKHQQYAEEAMRSYLMQLQQVFDKQIRRKEPWKKDSTILLRAMTQSARYNMMKSKGVPLAEINKSFFQKTPMRVFKWSAAGSSYLDTTMTPWDSLTYYQRFLESGMVCIDPANGHVLAWVGGIDHRYFQYDHARQAKRQVGSTFKPFVYTAAFDNGFSPCHEELNMPFAVETPTGLWMPKNADETQGGYLTLRKALARSVNIITARLVRAIGPQVVVDYAHKMGIESKLEPVYALSLGVSDLSVMELTGAYATFAAKGRWHEPIFVRRIEDKFGNVLEDFVGDTREALSEETAYLMVDMLRSVVNEGSGYPLRTKDFDLQGLDMGGKTGTTQNHSDGWFVGITPYFACGVWVGNSDRSVHFPDLEWGQGARMALPIWGRYMEKVYKDKELNVPRDFFARPGALKVEIDCKKYREKFPSRTDEEDKKARSGNINFDD
jgi:penicillin-binding protein 1A